MSVEDYCPEIDNDPAYELVDNSDTSSSDEEGLDCGECFDCSKNSNCPAKEADLKVKENKIQNMIKEEIEKLVKPKVDLRKTKEFKSLGELSEVEKSKLSDLEKINLVAVAFHRNGGINLDNIIELKQLVILISATAEIEGFKEFPRNNVLKLLDMIIYHANSHMAILNV
tara:strand:- start:545 stop:1054 length:510 start_codon:yes stop_codon:yes gene_type:complete